MTDPQISLELDCRDMRCPLPIIELARAIGSVRVGDVLAVVARDPAAGVDVQAWCRMRAQQYLGSEQTTDGAPRYLVRRLS